MTTSENRRVQMTKRLLKHALIELMQHTTLSKMTIKALCAKADVNRSTFYLHYADQFALLREVEQEAMDDALSALRNVDTTLTSLAYLEAFMGYIRENKAVFQVLLVNPDNPFEYLEAIGKADPVGVTLSGRAPLSPQHAAMRSLERASG